MYMAHLLPRQGGPPAGGGGPRGSSGGSGGPPGMANSPFAAPMPKGANHANQRADLIIPSVILLVVMLMCVGARMYSRARLLKFLGADDYVLMAASTAACIMALVNCIGTSYGFGTHIWDIPKTSIPTMRQLIYSNTIIFHLGINLTKISLLIFIHRLTGVSRKMRTATLTILAFLVVYTTVFLFLIVFQCRPIRAVWDRSLQGPGVCWPDWYLYVAGGINVFTDVVILVLPMPVLSQLKLPNRQKWGVMFVFALGGLVCMASIFRIVALRLTLAKRDPYEIRIHYATLIEMDVAIICGSLPALKPLLQRHFPSIFGSLSSTSASSSGSATTSRPGQVGTATKSGHRSLVTRASGGKGEGWDKMREYELEEQEQEHVRKGGKRTVSSGTLGKSAYVHGSESTEQFARVT